MHWQDNIHSDPKILSGKPVVRRAYFFALRRPDKNISRFPDNPGVSRGNVVLSGRRIKQYAGIPLVES